MASILKKYIFYIILLRLSFILWGFIKFIDCIKYYRHFNDNLHIHEQGNSIFCVLSYDERLPIETNKE